jgi:hypothetical protein
VPHTPILDNNDDEQHFLFDETPPHHLLDPPTPPSPWSPGPTTPPAAQDAPRRPGRPSLRPDAYAERVQLDRPPEVALPGGRWLRSFAGATSPPQVGPPGHTPAARHRTELSSTSSAGSSPSFRTIRNQLSSMMNNAFPPSMASPAPRPPSLTDTVNNFFPPLSFDDEPHGSGQQQPPRPRGRPRGQRK